VQQVAPLLFDLLLMFDFHFELCLQEADTTCDQETIDIEERKDSFANETTNKGSFSSVSSGKSPKLADNYEAIKIEGQEKTGVWIHQPGSEVPQMWEPRKGKSRRLDTEIQREPNDISGCNSTVSGSLNNDSSSPDDNAEDKHRMKTVRKGLHKIGSVFRRSRKMDDNSGPIAQDFPSPRDNIRSVNASKGVGVKFVMDDNIAGFPTGKIQVEGGSTEGSGPDSPAKRDIKDKAKNIFKHAEKSACSLKHVLSRKSRKSKGDSAGTFCERENESDSSGDESLSVQSPKDARTKVVSQAIAPCNIGSPKSDVNEVHNVRSPKSDVNVVHNMPSNTTVVNKEPQKAFSPERSNEKIMSGEHDKEEMVADKRVVSSIAE